MPGFLPRSGGVPRDSQERSDLLPVRGGLLHRHGKKIFAALLVAAGAAFAASALWGGKDSLTVRSEPTGLITTDVSYHDRGDSIPVTAPPVVVSGYHFAYWTLDGVRQTNATGLSVTNFSFLISQDSEAVAVYVPSDQSSGGVADWYKLSYYGTTNVDSSSDTDGDGRSLLDEYLLGATPLVPDTAREAGVIEGGISCRRSVMMTTSFDTNYVQLTQISDPPGVIDSSTFVAAGGSVSTVNPPRDYNGYRFAGWVVNGVRQVDANGMSLTQPLISISGDTVAVATYFPVDQVSGGDGIPDWYKFLYYGTTNVAAGSDTDGDGLTLSQEYAAGTSPGSAVDGPVREGGISSRRAPMMGVAFAADQVQLTQSSDPPGIVSDSSFTTAGKTVTTVNAPLDYNGYRFGGWMLNGVRQTDQSGTAVSQATFVIDRDTEAVAVYLPVDQVSGGDGIPDWYKYLYYGTTNVAATDDSDHDGYSLSQEYVMAGNPDLRDGPLSGGLIEGGTSHRRGPMMVYNLKDIGAPPPVITLSGPAKMTISLGSAFVDPGATVVDPWDGTNAIVDSGAVNTNDFGIYFITYAYTNSHGVEAEPVTRTVNVVEAPPLTPATVTMGNLFTIYDGTPKGVTVSTFPEGLPLRVTYNGGPVVPVSAGSYTVTATVLDDNFTGSATGTLQIARMNSPVTFPALPPLRAIGSLPVTLSATSPAGLPVRYTSSDSNVAVISDYGVADINTDEGDFVVELLGSNAPGSVAGFLTYSNSYTNTFFDRSDAGVRIFAGGYEADGDLKPITLTGAASNAVSNGASLPMVRGSVAMVPAGGDRKVPSQWYVNLSDNRTRTNVTGTVFGKVLGTGMDVADRIGSLPVYNAGAPFTAIPLTGVSSNQFQLSTSNLVSLTATYVPGPSLTIVGAGTATITAIQDGDNNHDSSSVSQTIAISNETQTIQPWLPIPIQGAGSSLLLTPPAASSGLPVIVYVKSGPANVSGGRVSFTGQGTVVLAANQPGNGIYLPAAESLITITVKKYSQTTAPLTKIPDQVYGVKSLSVQKVTSSSKLPVTLAIKSGPATISGTAIKVTGAGTVVVAANQPGNADYAPAPEVIMSFQVRKADQKITPPSPITPKSFGMPAFAMKATKASSGLPVTVSVLSGPATLTGTMLAMTGTGTVTLAFDQAGDANFNTAPRLTSSFVVAKAKQKIAAWPKINPRKLSDGPLTLIAPKADSGLPITLSVKSGPARISGGVVIFTGSGTVVIAADQSGNENYLPAAPVTTSISVK